MDLGAVAKVLEQREVVLEGLLELERRLVAARQAWDRLDAVLVVALVALAVVTALVCVVLLVREKSASWRRRIVASSVVAVGCTIFAVVVGRKPKPGAGAP